MKNATTAAVFLGAALFMGMGPVSLSATEMKCGAGKCGAVMQKQMKKMKCDEKRCAMKQNKAYCDTKKMKKKEMKCDTGKCDSR